MSLTLKNSAVTALLLSLDQEKSREQAEATSNTIAEKVVPITVDATQAKTLFQSEKRLIGVRGDDIEDYLLSDEISTREVLEAYYRGVSDRNNFRRLSNNYTISEMMLMLGTFMNMMEVRESFLTYSKNSSRKVRISKCVRRFTAAPSQKADMDLLENLISGAIESEEKMLSYMRDQVTVIIRAILEEMGSNFGLATKTQIQNICTSSHELCLLSPVMAGYFRDRRERMPMVQGDVIVLESCGETSKQLYETINFQNGEAKRTK